MMVYVMSRKGTTMHVDNPLLYEFIRTAHNPNPLRAARLRPFAYPSGLRPLDSKPAKVKSACHNPRVKTLVVKIIATVLGLIPVNQPAPAPCC
jgi:hypothetical protein